jgi:hypothetical protein
MKKKLLTSLLALLCMASMHAQTYTFTQLTTTYENLASPTLISASGWDDFTVYTIPLPFSFKYFDKSYTTLYAMGGFDGFVYDGAGSFGSYEIYSFDNGMTDLSGNATISYKTIGTAPNRIFKVQTLNANFDSDDTKLDYANVQLWLYEGSNVIEMHYGPSSIANAKTWEVPGCAGPTVGILASQTSFVCLSGAAANPTASTTIPSLCVTGAPPANMVYRFAPSSNGIEELNNGIPVSIAPNPSNGTFTITSDFYSNSNAIVSIKNNLGQIVYNEALSLGTVSKTIHTELEAGIYFVQLSTDKNYTVKKIIIQ